MFGFIKFIQITLKRIKENKRLWFTLIFLTSSLGIIFSIIFLNFITNNTQQKVFKSQSRMFESCYDNFHKMKLNEFKRLSAVLMSDNNLSELLTLGEQEQISTYFETLNETIGGNQTEKMSVRFYGANEQNLNNLVLSVLQTRNTTYGYSVMNDGVYNTYLEPIIIDGNAVGVLQLINSLEGARNFFSNLKKEYVFLLNKNVASNIALADREENYTQINDEYLYSNKIFISSVPVEISSMATKDFRDFADNKYIVTQDYFLTYDNVIDLNGVNIGSVVIGEKIDNTGSFLTIVKKLSDQVIMVALGLIISMLLFMF